MTEIAITRIRMAGLLAALDRLACLTPQQRKIIAALGNKRGLPVPRDALIEEVYGDRADGGALSARSVLRTQISNLRKMGFPIVTHGWSGCSLAVDRPVKAAKRRRRKAA